jgi:hypothetical protein
MPTATSIDLVAPTSSTSSTGIGTVTGTDANLTVVRVATTFNAVKLQCSVANGTLQLQGVVQAAAPNAAAFTIVAGAVPYEVLKDDCAPASNGYWQFGVAGNTVVWHLQGAQRRVTGHA